MAPRLPHTGSTSLLTLLLSASLSLTACSGGDGGKKCAPGFSDAALAANPTVFVSETCGDDNESGLSEDASLATLTAAASKAVAGDVVAVAEGSYAGGAAFAAGVVVIGSGVDKTTVSGGTGPALQFTGSSSANDANSPMSEVQQLVIADAEAAGVQAKGTALKLTTVGIVRTTALNGKGGHGVQLVGGASLELINCAVIGSEGAGVLANNTGGVAIVDPYYLEAGGVRIDTDALGIVDPYYEPSPDAPAAADTPAAIIDPAFSPAAIIDPAFIVDPYYSPGGAGADSIVDPYYSPAGIIDPAFSPQSNIGANGAGGVAIIDPAFSPGKPDIAQAALTLDATKLQQNNGFGVVVTTDVENNDELPVLIKRSAILTTLAPETPGAGGGDGVVLEGGSLVLDANSAVALSQRAGIALHDAGGNIEALVSFSGRGGVWADGELGKLDSGDDLRVMGNEIVGMLVEDGASIEAIGGVVDNTDEGENGEGGEGVVIRDQAKGSINKMTLKSTKGAAILVDDPAIDEEEGAPDVEIKDCSFEDTEKGVVIQNVKQGAQALADAVTSTNSFQTVQDAVDTDGGYDGPGSLCVANCAGEGAPAPGPDVGECADPALDSDNDGSPDCDEQAACPPGAEQTDVIAPNKAETCDQLDNDCDGVVDEGCDCPPNTFGPTCAPCTCGVNGICDDGPQGSGACTCEPGFAGPPACDTCAKGFLAPDCNGCKLGYTGQDCGSCREGFEDGPAADCDVCSEGYFGENCDACTCGANQLCADGQAGDGACSCPAGTFGESCEACACGPKGTCSEGISGDGSCACAEGFAGPTCEECAPGRFGPNCEACACGAAGTCDEGIDGDGSCACDAGFDGATCEQCAEGFWGAECTACACGDQQTCDDGIDGSGACTCTNGWVDVDSDGSSGSAGNGCECAVLGAETCGNAIDDDCDGNTDDPGAVGCTELFADADKDGYGVGNPSCRCAAVGLFTAVTNGDCDDANVSANPGGTETCNGFDDDCDGGTDVEDSVGCSAFYLDGDQDDWGQAGDSKCLCAGAGLYTAVTPTDCDDNNPQVSPGDAELCNGTDDDCDNDIDEEDALGCVTYFIDADQDSFGLTGDSKCMCQAGSPYDATVGGDCNDGDDAIFPGATELCDGVDNDCAGGPDDAFPLLGDVCTVGQGICAASGVYVCGASGEQLVCGAVPAQPSTEVCNGLDDNCDGSTDEDFPELGNPCANGLGACTTVGNTVCTADGTGTECDAVPAQPGAELCDGNGIDEDCDGVGDLQDDDADKACADGNGCTDDVCSPAGCTNPNVQVQASCTGVDLCVEGFCSEGSCDLGEPSVVLCDDDNFCTADSCDPNLGCVYTPTNDGGGCNKIGTCNAGVCEFPLVCGDFIQFGAEECDDGNNDDLDGCSATCVNECLGVSVDGTGSEYVQVTSGAAPRDFTTDDWTVDLVVTIDANQSGLGSFLLFYAGGDGTELYLGVEPNFALRVYHDAVPVGSVGATSPPGAVPTNVPVHIVMRRVGPTIDVYVDGLAVAGLDAVAGPSDPQKNTGDGFTLGALPSEQINDQAIAATYGLFRVSWDDLYGNSAKTVSSWSSFESCAATQCTYANFVDMSTQPTTTGGSYNAAITYSGGATVLHSGLLCDTCGNGQQDAFEECDDGNDDDGDACSNACTINGMD